MRKVKRVLFKIIVPQYGQRTKKNTNITKDYTMVHGYFEVWLDLSLSGIRCVYLSHLRFYAYVKK